MRGSDWALGSNEPYSNVLFYSKKTSPVEQMQSLYYIYIVLYSMHQNLLRRIKYLNHTSRATLSVICDVSPRKLDRPMDWWQTLHECFSQYYHGLTDQPLSTRLVTSSTDKHYSLDSEDDSRSGCRNLSHKEQIFPDWHLTLTQTITQD